MWNTSCRDGLTQTDLVDQLLKRKVFTSTRVANTLRAIDRKAFVSDQTLSSAYEDHPLPIGNVGSTC